MGQASQIGLATKFQITPGSMSTMVSRLEAMRLISRFREPDECRRDVLYLTEEGQTKV